MKFKDLNEDQLYEVISDFEIILDDAVISLDDESIESDWPDPDKVDLYIEGYIDINIPFSSILDRGMAVSDCVAFIEECMTTSNYNSVDDALIDELHDSIYDIVELEISGEVEYEGVEVISNKNVVSISFSYTDDIESDYPDEPAYY